MKINKRKFVIAGATLAILIFGALFISLNKEGFISKADTLTDPTCPDPLTNPVSQACYLRAQTAPKFKPGHTLVRLGYTAYELPKDTYVEMAKRWGYGLQILNTSENTFKNTIDDAKLANPVTSLGKYLKVGLDDPDTYPLTIYLDRDSEPSSFPEGTFFKDRFGNILGSGTCITCSSWSTDPPESYLRQKLGKEVNGLVKLVTETKARIAVIEDAAERGLTISGYVGGYVSADPNTAASRGDQVSDDYVSQKKAYIQSVLSQVLRSVTPEHQTFVYYTSGARDNFRTSFWRNSGPAWQYNYMNQVADLPTNEMYYRLGNDGWIPASGDPHQWPATGVTIPYDALTQQLNGKVWEIANGQPLSFLYVAGGINTKNQETDTNHTYTGFLKMLYAAGMIGADEFYYDSGPATLGANLGGYLGPIDPNNPPPWTRQIMALGQVHGLFSYLEPIIRNGDLLSGYNNYNYLSKQNQKSYEFVPTQGNGSTNPATQDRVIARKLRSQDKWIVAAWAADGIDNPINVTIKDDEFNTNFTLNNINARAAGSVYLVTLESGSPVATLIDTDPLKPSLNAASMYEAGQLNF